MPYWATAVIPGPILSTILIHLPNSCVNLELDLDNYGSEETHACPAIQSLLPRLHHLRLHLRSMCPALCSPNTACHDQVYPSLKTCIVNCSPKIGQTNPCNHTSNDSMVLEGENNSLIKSLSDIHFNHMLPCIERLVVIDRETERLDNHPWSKTSYCRTDILENNTLKAPCNVEIVGNRQSGYTILVPGGKLQSLYRTGIYAFLEGRTWMNTMMGSKLPSALLGPDEKAVCPLEWIGIINNDGSRRA